MVTKTNEDRLLAIEEGRKIYSGSSCRKCGHTQRYVNGHSCINCLKQATTLRNPEISKRYNSSEEAKQRKVLRAREWRARQKTGKLAPGQTYVDFNASDFKTKEQLKYINERLIRPTSRHQYDLKRKYGMTLDEYNQKYDDQNGTCKICGDANVRLVVDHCHESGIIRDLLCHGCNVALGFARDRVDILSNMVEYLSRHKGTVNG